MEHRDDPGCWPYPSIWSTEEMLNLLERCSLQVRSLHQCMCGGPCKKPTRLMGNPPGLHGEGLYCDGSHEHEKSVGRTATGGFLSQRLSLYPSGMCEMIAGWFVTGFERMCFDGSGPTGWRRGTDSMRRISAWTTVASDRRSKGVTFLNKTVVRGTTSNIDRTQSVFYPHVDDGAFFSASSEDSDALMQEFAVGLEGIGLRVGPKTEAQSCIEIVGYSERSPARLRLCLPSKPCFSTGRCGIWLLG